MREEKNMARKSNYSFQKFEREKVRQKKKQEKQDRKQEAKDRKAAVKEMYGDVDPDIVGIAPGPQPAQETDGEA